MKTLKFREFGSSVKFFERISLFDIMQALIKDPISVNNQVSSAQKNP